MTRKHLAPLLLLLLGVLLAPAAGRAEEPASQAPPALEKLDSAFASIDRWFGANVVGPIASVLFFDVAFWDDQLPAGELPPEGKWRRQVEKDDAGNIVKIEEVTGFEEGRGYIWQEVLTVSAGEVVPVPDEPVTRRVGGLEVQVRFHPERHVLWGEATRQEVSWEALGVPQPEGEDPRSVEGGSLPFPVTADPATGEVIAGEGPVPADTLEVVAGAQVWVPSAESTALVTEQTPEGQLKVLSSELRYDDSLLGNPENVSFPVVVAWLVFGACFFTARMVFINVRGFVHAVKVTTGAYDVPGADGEISHFQALASALSATVGLGNIAGVAIAVGIGGPGAVFWMIVAGILGMSSKFTECTLGQMYRVVRPDGTVSGGPMHYLSAGIPEIFGEKKGSTGPATILGYGLAGMFALLCIGGSFGGGNMFQANQSFATVYDVAVGVWPSIAADPTAKFTFSLVYGIVLAAAVGLVIIGGIKRIGAAAGIIVPVMCGIYILAGLWVMIVHAAEVPHALGIIVSEAFTPQAGLGGMFGVIAKGFQRASFSNEAGIGSASIAHSAATTRYPVREGIVALLEPFIDTVMVCTMTGIVVVVTGAYKMDVPDGAVMTSTAFGTVIGWFPYVLSLAVVLFAFSTMISWSYYGERCATWLFGERARLPYKVIFLFFVVFGAVFKLGNVLDFSDLMILGMAAPNILGLLLLSGKVKRALDDYWGRLHAGEFDAPPQVEPQA